MSNYKFTSQEFPQDLLGDISNIMKESKEEEKRVQKILESFGVTSEKALTIDQKVEYQKKLEEKEEIDEAVSAKDHYKGLKNWVTDYNQQKKYGNHSGAAKTKSNINAAIKQHKLDSKMVWGDLKEGIQEEVEKPAKKKFNLYRTATKYATAKKNHKKDIRGNDDEQEKEERSSDDRAEKREEAKLRKEGVREGNAGDPITVPVKGIKGVYSVRKPTKKEENARLERKYGNPGLGIPSEEDRNKTVKEDNRGIVDKLKSRHRLKNAKGDLEWNAKENEKAGLKNDSETEKLRRIKHKLKETAEYPKYDTDKKGVRSTTIPKEKREEYGKDVVKKANEAGKYIRSVLNKRKKGVVKEENIQELSKGTLKKYVSKATTDKNRSSGVDLALKKVYFKKPTKGSGNDATPNRKVRVLAKEGNE